MIADNYNINDNCIAIDGGFVSDARTDRHILSGVIKVNGLPAKKRVAVFHRTTLNRVAVTNSSSSDGTWQISGITEYPEQSLLVVAFDDSGEYNAEVADFVSQVAAS